MFLQGGTTDDDPDRVDNCGIYLDWNNINFENSLAAVKKLNSGNVMNILKNMAECLDHLQQDQRCQ